jgi:hypothetical protein
MHDRRPLGAAMLLLIGVAACAHAQPERATEGVAAASPKLIGCNGYTPPPVLYANERVDIEVMVLPDGSVESSSPRYRPLGGFKIQKDESVIQEALSLATGCFFEPAQRGEEPVEAWATVRFAFG